MADDHAVFSAEMLNSSAQAIGGLLTLKVQAFGHGNPATVLEAGTFSMALLGLGLGALLLGRRRRQADHAALNPW